VKVLHIITGLASGGAETQLDLLMRYTRHHCEVVSLYNFGLVGQQMVASGIKVRDLGMRSNQQISAVFRLARSVRRGRYDAVHVHLYRACIYGRVAARLAGVPVVVTTEHSLGDTQIEGRPKGTAVRAMYLATDRLSDVTVAVSPRVRERLISWGVPARKIRVIPNGLDFERFAFDPEGRKAVRRELGIPLKDFVLGSVGRLDPIKGYDLLIEAAEPLCKSGAWLLLVGEGPEKARLEKLARERNVGQRVIFAGERRDVPQLLSAMDLFAAPSREETFGLSILEAVAVGLRVVFTECPALKDLQLNNVRWVPGSVQQLGSTLRSGRAGKPWPGLPREVAKQRYDIRSVAAAVDNLYEAVGNQWQSESY